jgi:hypothetical protein
MSVSVSRSWLGWVGLVAGMTLMVGGCTTEKERLEAIAKTAASSRTAAATALRNGFFAKEITANAAMNMAHERVDAAIPAGSTTPTRTPSAADIAFAGAVLDFLDQCEPDIDKQVINDFFWIRVGTLAGNAAAAAKAAGDDALAANLVLAGPPRWQNEVYWRQCPGHDALASILLFQTGREKEALGRLKDRADLPEEVEQAKAMIEKEMKKRPRR